MPIEDESLGAVFASGLAISKAEAGQLKKFVKPGDFSKAHDERSLDSKKKILEETFRVLEQGGILVWQKGQEADFDYAQKLGFIPKRIEAPENLASFNGIFEKPKTYTQK